MNETPRTKSGDFPPATYFASAERATSDQIAEAVKTVSDSPVLGAVMEIFGGWVAVLNEHRQVLAVNHAFLNKLGVNNPAEVLGLRPGEVVHCVHANDHDAGCGTGKFCATCGAVLAMVAAQETEKPQERECVMTTQHGKTQTDNTFMVNCSPLTLENMPLLLLSMHDISAEKRRSALERTFLHDISNVLTALGGAAAQLTDEGPSSDPMLLNLVREASNTLYREIRVQRLLCQEKPGPCQMHLENATPAGIMHGIESIFAQHPAALDKKLRIERPLPEGVFSTDIGLLTRVLINMVVNAFEASKQGGEVEVWSREDEDSIAFFVRNQPAIPENVAMRVLQRYFSTKPGPGRGLGTHAMKLIGETLLGGEVGFENDPVEGVTFWIRCPRVLEVAPYNA